MTQNKKIQITEDLNQGLHTSYLITTQLSHKRQRLFCQNELVKKETLNCGHDKKLRHTQPEHYKPDELRNIVISEAAAFREVEIFWIIIECTTYFRPSPTRTGGWNAAQTEQLGRRGKNGPRSASREYHQYSSKPVGIMQLWQPLFFYRFRLVTD